MRFKFWSKLEDIITPREGLLLICLGYIGIDIPLSLAFVHPPNLLEIAFDFVISALFIYDFTASHLRTQLHPTNLYTKLLELVAALPVMGLASFLLEDSHAALIYLQTLHFFRLPRLVRTLIDRTKNKLPPKRFKFSLAALITTLVLNTFACGWLLIYPSNEDTNTSYIKALYWLVTTIATVGYGDITPTSNGGRIYAMFMMVMGATIWGILIASASRMMLASDRRKEKRREKMEALQSFFNHYEVPKQLQSQVVGFYNHLLTQKLSEDERAVLSELPAALQGELQVYMNLKPISRVSLFEGVSFECLSQVAKRLEQTFFAPGASIIRQGEVGHEMYLIGHGSVTIHTGDQFIAKLDEGQCFGEFALIENSLRTTDVTAATYCDMFKLSKEKFEELCSAHADLRENIERIMATRKFKVVSTDTISKKLNHKAS